MRRYATAAALLGLVSLAGAMATAQEKTDPEQIVIGVLMFHLNSNYPSVEVDGQSWDNVYFEDDGLTLMLTDVDRTVPHTVKLSPLTDDDSLRHEEYLIVPKDWTLAKIDKITRQWRVVKTVGFRAWKPGEKEEYQKKLQEAADEAARRLELDPTPVPPEDGKTTDPIAPPDGTDGTDIEPPAMTPPPDATSPDAEPDTLEEDVPTEESGTIEEEEEEEEGDEPEPEV